jgi:hypothetical protein
MIWNSGRLVSVDPDTEQHWISTESIPAGRSGLRGRSLVRAQKYLYSFEHSRLKRDPVRHFRRTAHVHDLSSTSLLIVILPEGRHSPFKGAKNMGGEFGQEIEKT